MDKIWCDAAGKAQLTDTAPLFGKKRTVELLHDISLLRLKGSYDEALQSIRKLGKEKGTVTGPIEHVIQGEASLAKGDHAAAKKSFESAVEADPTFTEAKELLGIYEASNGDKTRALDLLICAPFEDDLSSLVAHRAHLRTRALQARSKLKRHNNDVDGAIADLDAVYQFVADHCQGRKPDRALRHVVEACVKSKMELLMEEDRVKDATQHLRHVIAGGISFSPDFQGRCLHQLAVVLLYGTARDSYPRFETLDASVFSPTTALEEANLALQLKDRAARSLKNVQLQTHQLIQNSQYLLSVQSMTRDFAGAVETLERVLPSQHDNVLLWQQFMLALSCESRNEDALTAAKHLLSMSSDDPLVCFTAAKICLNHNMPMMAFPYIQLGVSLCSCADNRLLLSKALHFQAFYFAQLALQVGSLAEVKEMHQNAISSYEQALQAGGGHDYLLLYHAALANAEVRDTTKACTLVKQSLQVNAAHAPSYSLLALLFSSCRRPEEALETCVVALADFPDDPSLLLIKAKLNFANGNRSEGFRALSEAFKAVSASGESGVVMVVADDGFLWEDEEPMDGEPSFDASRAKSLDLGSAALSAEASEWSLHGASNGQVKTARLSSAMLWSSLAQSFRDAEQWEDAHACVDEMRRLYPRLPQSMYERGRMLECEMKRAMKAGDISTMEELRAQALECYHRVLTDDSSHLDAMLGIAYIKMGCGEIVEAESLLITAVRKYPINSNAWKVLGKLLRLKGHNQSGSECFLTALNLEESEPVVSFDILPRSM